VTGQVAPSSDAQLFISEVCRGEEERLAETRNAELSDKLLGLGRHHTVGKRARSFSVDHRRIVRGNGDDVVDVEEGRISLGEDC